MKTLLITVLLLLLSFNLSAQSNTKVAKLLENDYKKSKEWVEEEFMKLSLDEKLGLYFILDGRNNNFSKNIDLIRRHKPAGLLTDIKSLESFANSVNSYASSANGTLIVLDSKDKIGLPTNEALEYPNAQTFGAVLPLKKLIITGNDLASQMKRIGADIIYKNSSETKEYDVVSRKLEAFQKGVWYKKRFLFYYQNENLSVSSKSVSTSSFKDKEQVFVVSNDISGAISKLKSAYNSGEITEGDIDKHTRLVLQIKHKTGIYEKPKVNLKLLKSDLNMRRYIFNKNEIENSAITLIRNPDQFIPLIVGEPEELKIACIAFGASAETDFQKKIKRYNDSKNFTFDYNDTIAQFYALEEQLDDYKIVFFEVYPKTDGSKIPEDWGVFIEKLNHTKNIVVSVFGKPEYLQELKRLPSYKTVLLCYENTQNIANTAAEIIFGEKPSIGTLPYTAGFPYSANDRKELKKTKRFVSEKWRLPPKRELRAAWIATVVNIDYPSKATLTASEQRAEFLELINMHQKNGINAIICQVSPSADAFYPSEILPWSQWLTGGSGVEPDEFYDPLEFMIEETHKRNIEFHAWFNPYRTKVSLKYTMSDKHISNTHPELMLTYGNRMYYDPGYDKTRTIVTSAIMEMINKYDIDGVHFDDYFYPYKIYGKEFPDSLSFAKESRGFAVNQKEDWRRDNVNLIIKMLHDNIKVAKPWVKFGISPFGVWRNKSTDPSGSDTKAGVTNYDVLYADIMLWMQEGWIDYIMPQVYWERGKTIADFDKIVDWWSKNNYGVPVYIGHGVYKTDKKSKIKAWQDVSEIPSQVRLVRSYPEIEGSAFYNTSAFVNNKMGLVDLLKKDILKYPALVPRMPLMDSKPPERPQNLKAKKKRKARVLSWGNNTSTNEMDKVTYYVVYKFEGEMSGDISKPENIYKIIRENKLSVEIENGLFRRKKQTFVITAFDRLHNESETSIITVKL